MKFVFYIFFVLIVSCQKYERVPHIIVNTIIAEDTAISSFIIDYTLVDLGENAIQEFGVCYDTNQMMKNRVFVKNDTILKTINYKQLITKLEPNKAYFVQSYIKEFNGNYIFSNLKTNNTARITPSAFEIQTSHLNYIFGSTSVTFAVNEKSFDFGNDPKTVFGICYSNTNSHPTINNEFILYENYQDSITIENLEPNTEYTFRAFAKNRISTNYTSSVTIRTSIFFNGIEMVYLTGADSTNGSYYVSRYEITEEVWNAITNNQIPTGKGSIPKGNISINEINIFLNSLNNISSQISGFKLPTQQQWLYAAKGKFGIDNYSYSGSNNIAEVAWYIENTGDNKPKNVGLKKQNSAGIYDMTGNVREICVDKKSRGGAAHNEAFECMINAYAKQETESLNIAGFRIIKQ